MCVGGLDLAFLNPTAASRSKPGAAMAPPDAERVTDKIFAKGPLVEGELDVERGRQRLSTFAMASSVKPLLQRRDVDAGRVGGEPWPRRGPISAISPR
jgi:hypothetical protein